MLPVGLAMIAMYATLPVQADSRAAAIDLVQELAERSREEPGVIDYRPAVDVAEENTIRIFEQYEDESAVEAHMSSDHFESFQADIAAHLAGEPTLYRYDVESKTQLM